MRHPEEEIHSNTPTSCLSLCYETFGKLKPLALIASHVAVAGLRLWLGCGCGWAVAVAVAVRVGVGMGVRESVREDVSVSVGVACGVS